MGSTVSRPVKKIAPSFRTGASYQVPPAIVRRGGSDDRGHLRIHAGAGPVPGIHAPGSRLKHSFLFEEALWRAHGEYSDASGKAAPVDGETSIKHLETRWLFEGVLRVRGERPALHHNRYDIVPFSPNARSTHWSSTNPAVGALRGRFILVGDAILSSYASPTGRYRGFE